MPELPEVETIVRDLNGLISGLTISSAEVVRPDLIGGSVEVFQEGLRGRRIDSITRRAKNILFHVGDDLLIVNLGMTGRLMVTTPDEEAPHLGVRFGLSDGSVLVYRDIRRFGRLELASAVDWGKREAQLGFEPLSEEFTPGALFELASRSRVAVKTWLMDQKRIVGVGNIYASEALFRARIDPRRPANSLTRPDSRKLHAGIRDVLSSAIEMRGTTFMDYRDAKGERGGFKDFLLVYDRGGLPCTVCKTPIVRIVQGGRSTFYCPKCQK
ncbi:MAG TPA: bifunctional DNA-formamidopyrimidine glycosylase/DNA-(apurinic or apyrimidinic site) lyase [Longimicrobiaceae bacterium]|nr:bifunctional DNA-formamidopyrimidine glycosylase/DNA-(apurinic or apyrimidinic site) lyase [Longimicrobiaceae bacterium]